MERLTLPKFLRRHNWQRFRRFFFVELLCSCSTDSHRETALQIPATGPEEARLRCIELLRARYAYHEPVSNGGTAMPSPSCSDSSRVRRFRCVSRTGVRSVPQHGVDAVVRRRYSSSASSEADIGSGQREQLLTDAVGFGPSIHPFRSLRNRPGMDRLEHSTHT
jgi:hypothetical protein